MSARLIPDVHLIGYWGFDEALETNIALDSSTSGDSPLVVRGSPSVQTGRIGAARSFDGSTTTAVAQYENYAFYSEEFNTSPWFGEGGPTVPVVTANAALAPDATMTADQIDIGAVGALQYSQQKQLLAFPANTPATYSVWLRAAAPCSTYIWIWDGVSLNASALVNVTTTWARYEVSAPSFASTTRGIHIGCNTFVDGQSPLPAHTVFAWGAQVSAGLGSIPYTKTTGAAASQIHTKFHLQGDLLLGAWARLTTYNSGGSFLRTIASCGGPTSGDNVLYALFVDSAGRLVYKHTATTGVVIVRSVPIIKASQFYCIFVRRISNGLNQDIEFFADNAPVAILDVTVNGVGSALPVPPPDTNASSVFSVGHSQKEADGAYWHGLLDEISVHDVARLYQPYLRAAYFQVSLRNTTTHLTGYDNLVAVSSADMGAGVRWWCFERDRDLYVVKESPFGFFGPETRLTTTGNNASTTAQKAELIYDAVTDTLIVFFVASNRIYKLTAQSTDDPATINMPFTADTGSILKVLDNVDGVVVGMGGGQRPLEVSEITYTNRSPVKVFGEDTPSYPLGVGGGQYHTEPVAGVTVPTLNFMDLPAPDGFGLAVGPRDGTQSGYRIFRVLGGANQLLGAATFKPGGFYFRAVSPIVGDVFVAEAIGRNGLPTGVFSNAVAYRGVQPVTQGNVIRVGLEGDCTDTLNGGVGGGQHANFETVTYVNRAPVKISGEDAPAYNIGVGGGQHGRVTTSGTNRPGNAAIEVELR